MFFDRIFFTLWFSLAATFAAGVMYAQPLTHLEELTTKDGLSHGFINRIFQDKEGFLWVSTRNGLNRYDGREVRVFMNDPMDPYSIAFNSVSDIIESGDYLIIRTHLGINLFHKKTQRFFSLEADAPFRQQLEGITTDGPLIDQQGRLWCRLATRGNTATHLLCITLDERIDRTPSGKQNNFKVKAIQRWKLHEKECNLFCQTTDKIWSTDNGQFISISKKTGVLQYHNTRFTPTGYCRQSANTVWFIGKLGIGRITESGIQLMETDFREICLMYFNAGNELTVISEDKLFHLALPDFKKPKLDRSEASFVLAVEQPLNFNSCLLDRSGVLWLGTNGFGLRKYTPRMNYFQSYFKELSPQTAVLIDAAGHFGIFSNKWRHLFLSDPNFTYRTASNLLGTDMRTFTDPRGRHWILTNREDQLLLYCQSEPGGHWDCVGTVPGNQNQNYAFELDTQNNLWIAGNNGLIRFDCTAHTFEIFNDGKVFRYGQIWDMQYMEGGVWWIAMNTGLIKAEPDATGYKFTQLQAHSGDYQSIQNNEVLSLAEDPKQAHVLWIGTRGGGLSRLDTRSMNYTHFNTRNGFPDNVVYGILADDFGMLWMSSNHGLIRLNPVTGAVKNYTEEDGLPANEFNVKCYGKLPDGGLAFGSMRGLVVFYPKDFIPNPAIPQLRITSVEINNHRFFLGDSTGLLTQAIEYTQRLQLSADQNNITLQFAALEYTTPSKNRFRYYMKGAEQEWAHTATENRAAYLNLPSGNYTFLLKGSNNDGVWNETPVALNITILPPWYRSWWAYLLYLAGIGGCIFLFYRYQLRQKLAWAENLRLKELDAFRSRVFTNITHEFRTPLTVIQGMADQMSEYDGNKSHTGVQRAGLLIKRNGTALLRLINQLLDLAKLDAHSLSLYPVRTDLIPFLKYLVAGFESLAAIKHIRLEWQSDRESISTTIDRDQVQTILHNLLSNAIKFTPVKGCVSVQLSGSTDWQNTLKPDFFRAVVPPAGHPEQWVSISIRDTGGGIAPDQLPAVFDRFYQSPVREGGGSGIGLALVKELVQLMQGALGVRSEPGEGTEFVVVLPVEQAAVSGEPESIVAEEQSTWRQDQALGRSVPEPESAEAPAGQTLPTLLIIEDNSDVLHYIKTCVEGSYRISTAANGQLGIELALETVPGIIISDLMMPLKDGFEVVKTLKNDERSSHIPIILLSAKADLDSRIKGLERGADAYLAKPFDKGELLLYLRNLLDLRYKLQERYSKGIPLIAKGQNHYEDIFINKVQSALEANMQDEDFGIPQLCTALKMSRSQLHNKLKALTGQSTSQYIRTARLHRAHELILSTDMNISEIAFAVGFRYAQHFSTSFTEQFGRPPSSLRK